MCIRDRSYTSKAKAKPVETSIKFLSNNTVKDGNRLYNIGPTPLGTVDPKQAETFLAMVKWIAPYREAIYNTRGGPYKAVSYTHLRSPCPRRFKIILVKARPPSPAPWARPG